MKLNAAYLFAIPAVGAFSPVAIRQRTSSSSLQAIVTGPKGKPASSFEEDLLLTLKIIQDHDARSVTVSKDQFISQMKEAASVKVEEKIDISIPYDAAAKLAYDASDKSLPYSEFKEKYEANAVAEVKAKRQPKVAVVAEPAKVVVDLSIPYDAAAKLAYEASDKSMPYPEFKVKYEEKAVAEVKAKRQPKVVPPKAAAAAVVVDLSIPYDAAAKLAYEASDKSMPYPAFKEQYEAKAVEEVKAKRQPKAAPAAAKPVVDLSIPYDAAAKLAYEKSDKSMPYPEFKVKYEADAVAEVIAKRNKSQ